MGAGRQVIIFLLVYAIGISFLLLYGYLSKFDDLLHIAPLAFLCFIISDWASRVASSFVNQGESVK